METPDLGSIDFSDNMTAAFETTSAVADSAALRVFTATGNVDENKVLFRYSVVVL